MGDEEHEGAMQTKYEVLGTMEMPEVNSIGVHT